MHIAPVILNSGATTTTAATATLVTIPAPGSGGAGAIRCVRVCADTVAYIKFGNASVVATANDIMVTNTPTIFNVAGCTNYSVIQGTAAAKINVVPVE